MSTTGASRSPAERVTRPPRIGAGCHNARLKIGVDGADRAGAPDALRPPGHSVAARRQRVAGFARDARFHTESAGEIVVRLETVGETVGGDARMLHCILRVHAE